MKDAIIHIEDLAFSYDEEPVLSDIRFDIHRGDFIAVIGPNGGGKTTLMRLILGLLKPQQGTITVFDQMPGNQPARIGYVPQHTNLATGFPATVEQVVLMGLAQGKRRGFRYSDEERQLAQAAMYRAGVQDLRQRRLNELSGGQRQRTLIARALITNPELLILDEPLSNIDPYGRQCILETLTGLKSDTTVVMVSHDLGITANSVTGIIAVNRYALAAASPQLTPEMLALMYGIHEAGCPVHALLQQLVESPKLMQESPHEHH
ncbi:MAG TPA: ABC transporter ATP-binding protein [Halothiobacillus sp.]|nr:ABC transporter ATP-binding protein [Halothiobacillus sp.]